MLQIFSNSKRAAQISPIHSHLQSYCQKIILRMNLFGQQTTLIVVTYGLLVAEMNGSLPMDNLIKLTRNYVCPGSRLMS